VRTRPLRRPLAIAAILAVSLTSCQSDPELVLDAPASKVPIEGTDRYRVTLTPEAAERLDIQTAEVSETELGLSISSDALILDIEGSFWVYVNSEPLTYERVGVSPVREEGGEAFFSDGPPPGTPVVVVGVPELYGEETGVGK